MRRSGFTLVELLVVIAIIGMLVGLLLPAVQQAREAARVMQCNNHLKQMGLAAMNHEAGHRSFPSSGWCYKYEGDPDMGFGATQPGAWTYSILPFIEQTALWNLGANGDRTIDNTIKEANLERIKTPVSIFYCPSRRAPMLYLGTTPGTNCTAYTGEMAKLDYAASGGDGWSWMEETTYDGGLNYKYSGGKTGMFFCKSAVTMGEIRDGTSNTYLYGEKYLDSSKYTPGGGISCGQGDDRSTWSGVESNDAGRNTGSSNSANLPRQDRSGLDIGEPFGSAHAGSFGVVMCDGSVQRVSYSVDAETHANLGKKADNNAATLPQ
ncbi:MAG: DUF1559 domain-containing protein [Planctomycetia bacterium]|nr:DUF1559 domain-containing protein [Planctomycetia bacterium]